MACGLLWSWVHGVRRRPGLQEIPEGRLAQHARRPAVMGSASKVLSFKAAAFAAATMLALAPVMSADWSVDILGPHGSVSFGDRPFVEYANVPSVPSYHDVLSPYGEWR